MEGFDKLSGGVSKDATADLAIIDGNPLDNFKGLYGMGVEKFSADRTSKVVGGRVKWTIKEGIVFDALPFL